MEKDIEKLLDNMVVPEMEYVKTKNAVAVPEVPEGVLPKTKAEMYREAKGRLDQKTVPASVAYEPKKKRAAKKRKTERKPDTDRNASDDMPKSETLEMLKKRIGSLRKIVEEPKWVGSADELVPFAWRNPLCTDIEKPTKLYRAAAGVPRERSLFLPVPHKNNQN